MFARKREVVAAITFSRTSMAVVQCGKDRNEEEKEQHKDTIEWADL